MYQSASPGIFHVLRIVGLVGHFWLTLPLGPSKQRHTPGVPCLSLKGSCGSWMCTNQRPQGVRVSVWLGSDRAKLLLTFPFVCIFLY